jgi:alpha-beta hydrolase superfamily lysophospholipase
MQLARILTSGGRRLTRWSVYAGVLALAVLATIVLVFAVQARLRLPDLRAWHTIELAGEFSARRAGAPTEFADYRKLEDGLFGELRRRVLDDAAAADTYALGRYNPRSPTARLAFETPYNRSYELVPSEIRGAALLVHGLSDAPYSMRAVAELLRDQGVYVLVLRLPGHGTVPAALRGVEWEDWSAAVALAARHAAARAGAGKPFYAGGFSTGGALVTLHALRALKDPAARVPDRLLLFSPAIGISRFAVLTNVVAGLAFLPYFEKSKWLDVLPEYDPYKYNSFPVNAANQIYGLTQALQAELAQAQTEGRLARMPPMLAFQSLVDATVTAADIAGRLFMPIASTRNELVVFDVNREAGWDALIARGPREAFARIAAAPALPFRLTMVGSRTSAAGGVTAYTREAMTTDVRVAKTGLAWPVGVFSLGHVAVPFPPDDPLYGIAPAAVSPLGFSLGNLAARGEPGALVVPLSTLGRLRSNPFFAVIQERIAASVAADRAR